MTAMPVTDAYLALPPLTDITLWARTNLLLAIALIIGTVLLTRLASWVSTRLSSRVEASSDSDALVRSEEEKYRRAVIQVVTWTILVVIYCIAAVLVVHLLGFPISGFVAPATVAGVALGFGAQRIVQDLLAGFFVITERQYGFGDTVRLSLVGIPQVTGTVEEVTLRSTRIRSLNGEVITTPNGQIVQVTNLSRDWARTVIDVPVPISTDVGHVTEALQQVCEEAFTDENLHELLLDRPTVMGVESLAVDQFNVRVVARTLPGKQFDVARALRSRISLHLLHQGIVVSPAVETDQPTGTV